MQENPKPGRPAEVDPEHLLRVALRLFEKKGYEQVTMAEIAAAASVSRRTLFRHFPSKAELVWHGLDDLLDSLSLRAAQYPPGTMQPDEVMDLLLRPTLEALEEPRAAELARRRLRLIAQVPTLLGNATLRQFEAVISEALAPKALPRGATTTLVARSLVAALFAALQWWAEEDTGRSPTEVTRAVLAGLGLVGGARIAGP